MGEAVGVLTLDHTRVDGPGSMFDADILGPVDVEIVPGATTVAMVDAPETVGSALVEHALALAERGCALITSNCGLSAGLQDDVVSATALPTALSGLLLAPLLWRVFGGGLGVLTYSAPAFTQRVRRASGWPDDLGPVLGEVRPLDSWRTLEGAAPLNTDSMRADLFGVASGVMSRGADRVMLVECTAMLPFLADLRREIELPIFSIFDLVALIRGGMTNEY